jgi:hypothetical protein
MVPPGAWWEMPRVYRDAKVTTEPAALLTSGGHAARSSVHAARLQCSARSAPGRVANELGDPFVYGVNAKTVPYPVVPPCSVVP